MIALAMLYATAIGTLLALGALALDRVAAAMRGARRWGWAAALALALLVPAVRLLRQPSLAGSPAPAGQPRRKAPSSQALAMPWLARQLDDAWPRLVQVERSRRLDIVLAIGWGCASLVLLAGYGAAGHRLARRRNRWRETAVHGVPVLVARSAGPAVIGALHPRIVLPEWALSLDDERSAMVLAHEREHVRAGDPLVAHLAGLAAMLVPWNVAVWWIARRLRLALELDCDARVLAAHAGTRAALTRRTYGDLLIAVAERHAGVLPAIAPALLERPSSLSRRIHAMHPSRTRRPALQSAFAAAVAALVFFVACESPAPALLAPDGKDQLSKRIVGDKNETIGGDSVAALVARNFPEVIRGETGPSVLFIVRDARGSIVRTSRADAPEAFGAAMKTPGPTTPAEAEELKRAAEAHGLDPMKTRITSDKGNAIPRELAALRPDQIASVDISKYKGGTFGPNPVSVVLVVTKK